MDSKVLEQLIRVQSDAGCSNLAVNAEKVPSLLPAEAGVPSRGLDSWQPFRGSALAEQD